MGPSSYRSGLSYIRYFQSVVFPCTPLKQTKTISLFPWFLWGHFYTTLAVIWKKKKDGFLFLLMTQVVWDDLLASHTDTPVYTCFCFSTLYWQCILLPQQHVHQHLSGVQWHTKLCLSLGWKQLQRYLLVPQHFVILSLKSCCAVVYCSGLHYAIWSVPCLALSCHIEPPWESAVIMTQDICNSLDSWESCSPLLFSFFFFNVPLCLLCNFSHWHHRKVHISKCLTVQNIPTKLPLGRKTRISSSLMALWLNVLDGLLAIYWYLSWFEMLLITSVALSQGSELFLETRAALMKWMTLSTSKCP